MAIAQAVMAQLTACACKHARTCVLTLSTAVCCSAQGRSVAGTSGPLVRFCIVIIIQQTETPRRVDNNSRGGLAGHPLAAGPRMPFDEVGHFSRPGITAHTQCVMTNFAHHCTHTVCEEPGCANYRQHHLNSQRYACQTRKQKRNIMA